MIPENQIDWENLRILAHQASKFSYCPCSKYAVGAAALVDDGRVLSGCNVENISIGLTLCAECSIVSQLYSTGGGKLIALTCTDGTGSLILPCGRCRQLLLEHGDTDLLIAADPHPLSLGELLPFAFGPAERDQII